jgi:hypothetical protein
LKSSRYSTPALVIILLWLAGNIQSQENENTPSITIDAVGDAHPYSHLRVNNDPDNFQFAIVTDRTGGHRAGVFEDAVRKLNLLQPEFVVSVGDLIEGYTRDEDRIYREWDEFNGFIDQLEMPFFYVPGNHDYINEVMARIWEEKFGPSYYHFVYKDVLFLCLNTEEAMRGSNLGGIEKPQFDYIKGVLEDHPDVKWTLVFMHQPLWLFDNTGYWKDVEALLDKREHTVFVGHHHHYVKYVRNNSKYFMLATTGGISRLRGPNFGEFDHVVWVTMTDEGPVIANLLLEGIWHEDVVTENLMEMLGADRIKITPLFVEDMFSGEEFELRITNDDNYPMQTLLRFGQHRLLSPEVVEYKKIIPPNSVEILNVPIHALRNARADEVKPIQLYAWFNYQYEDGREIRLDAQYGLAPVKEIVLDRRPRENINLDGSVEEWSSLPFRGDLHSEVTGETEGYRGDYDASYQFNVQYDNTYFYIGLSVWDDEMVVDDKASLWDQDGVVLSLDARPVDASANNRGAERNRDFMYLHFAPGLKRRSNPQIEQPEALPEGIVIETVKTLQGFDAEIAIPIRYLKKMGGGNWKSVRLNLVYQDKDGDDNRTGLWWRPDWSSDQNYIGSGTIFKNR